MKHFPEMTKALLAAFLVAGLSSGFAAGAEARGKDDSHGKHGKHGKNVRVVRMHPNGKGKQIVVRGIPHPTAVRSAVRVVQAHPQFGRVDFGVYRRGTVWVARPAAPRAFIVPRGRITVIRPVPIWTWVPARRGVSVNVRYQSHDVCGDLSYARLTPQYGCAFCDAGFTSYRAWERHARGCAGGHVHGRLAFESWDDGDLDYFRARLEVSKVFG